MTGSCANGGAATHFFSHVLRTSVGQALSYPRVVETQRLLVDF